jgi:oxalate decarboxylase/phosphoglucose isomerase-like protein (cupin superfamily)
MMSSRKVNSQETINIETVIDTGAGVLIDLLKHRWGVRHVFGYPGDGINGVIEALWRRRDIVQFVQMRHEEAAAFAAAGYAKFTGRLGVCLATSGPGAIHLLNGLYDARADQAPVLAMMSQEPHFVGRGGTEWLVDQNSFPIASSIASVWLNLAPGGLRELHWHPNADEWQYILKGTVRMTMFGPHGRYRTEVFEAGDTGYIPMGYGHSIENASDKEPAEVLIGFNTGQYEGINLSTWLAANPSYVLEENFALTPDVTQKLPRHQQFVIPKEGPDV